LSSWVGFPYTPAAKEMLDWLVFINIQCPEYGAAPVAVLMKKEHPMIRLKRAYDPATGDDGARFLVERLWPRGVRKARLKLDGWLKDVAPSADLRKWFSHDPKKWPAFRQRYFAELRAHRAAWQPLLAAARRGRVTFVYAAHDVARNGAVALKAFLDRRL
jgi:uncharacterized protein YeaO (DUF488 family)